MTNPEKITSIFIAILLFLVVALSVTLLNTREQIGDVEAERNRIHNSRIAIYDNRILTLNEFILTLQAENDSLRNEKAKVITVTIHEIDSIRALPFDGKSNFWTIEAARVDSIRARYNGIN